MEGSMFVYHPKRRLVAFKTGKSRKRSFIFIGGLGDGLDAQSYLHPLAAELVKADWSLVQFVMRSSYDGWGVSSLANDVSDLSQLIRHLDCETVVLCGHSTGCQDICHYFATAAHGLSSRVHAVILQGNVSDREMLSDYEDCAERLACAQKMIEDGRALDCLPHKMWLFGAPVSAERYVSLAAKGGIDDYFSSDLTDEELAAKLGPVSVPTLIVMSEQDEAVPSWVNKEVLLKRMCAAMPKATGKILPGDHSLHGQSEPFVRLVMDFLHSNFPPKVVESQVL